MANSCNIINGQLYLSGNCYSSPVQTISVTREGICNDPISVTLISAPSGLTMAPGSIPSNQSSTELNFTVASNAVSGPIQLQFVGCSQTTVLNGFFTAENCADPCDSFSAVATAVTSQPVTEGNPAVFTVTVSNSQGSLSYVWQLNTGSGWNNIPAGVPYSGENTQTLTVNPTSISQNNYQYRCVVTDGVCGTVNSSPVTLQIICDQAGWPKVFIDGSEYTGTPIPLLTGETYPFEFQVGPCCNLNCLSIPPTIVLNAYLQVDSIVCDSTGFTGTLSFSNTPVVDGDPVSIIISYPTTNCGSMSETFEVVYVASCVPNPQVSPDPITLNAGTSQAVTITNPSCCGTPSGLVINPSSTATGVTIDPSIIYNPDGSIDFTLVAANDATAGTVIVDFNTPNCGVVANVDLNVTVITCSAPNLVSQVDDPVLVTQGSSTSVTLTFSGCCELDCVSIPNTGNLYENDGVTPITGLTYTKVGCDINFITIEFEADITATVENGIANIKLYFNPESCEGLDGALIGINYSVCYPEPVFSTQDPDPFVMESGTPTSVTFNFTNTCCDIDCAGQPVSGPVLDALEQPIDGLTYTVTDCNEFSITVTINSTMDTPADGVPINGFISFNKSESCGGGTFLHPFTFQIDCGQAPYYEPDPIVMYTGQTINPVVVTQICCGAIDLNSVQLDVSTTAVGVTVDNAYYPDPSNPNIVAFSLSIAEAPGYTPGDVFITFDNECGVGIIMELDVTATECDNLTPIITLGAPGELIAGETLQVTIENSVCCETATFVSIGGTATGVSLVPDSFSDDGNGIVTFTLEAADNATDGTVTIDYDMDNGCDVSGLLVLNNVTECSSLPLSLVASPATISLTQNATQNVTFTYNNPPCCGAQATDSITVEDGLIPGLILQEADYGNAIQIPGLNFKVRLLTHLTPSATGPITLQFIGSNIGANNNKNIFVAPNYNVICNEFVEIPATFAGCLPIVSVVIPNSFDFEAGVDPANITITSINAPDGGYNVTSYLWQFSTNNGASWSDVVGGNPSLTICSGLGWYGDPTSPTLVLHGVPACADNYQYRVRVRRQCPGNPLQTFYSNATVLNIVQKSNPVLSMPTSGPADFPLYVRLGTGEHESFVYQYSNTANLSCTISSVALNITDGPFMNSDVVLTTSYQTIPGSQVQVRRVGATGGLSCGVQFKTTPSAAPGDGVEFEILSTNSCGVTESVFVDGTQPTLSVNWNAVVGTTLTPIISSGVLSGLQCNNISTPAYYEQAITFAVNPSCVENISFANLTMNGIPVQKMSTPNFTLGSGTTIYDVGAGPLNCKLKAAYYIEKTGATTQKIIIGIYKIAASACAPCDSQMPIAIPCTLTYCDQSGNFTITVQP